MKVRFVSVKTVLVMKMCLAFNDKMWLRKLMGSGVYCKDPLARMLLGCWVDDGYDHGLAKVDGFRV